MWKLTELADWFDERRHESDAILDRWLEQAQFDESAKIVAATTHAVTTFGAGFVDLLRLGDGARTGGASGWGHDALRFAAVFPLGKAVQAIRSVHGMAGAKLIADTGGPHCFWIASAKALRQVHHAVGGRVLASVDDLARALGMPSSAPLWSVPSLHFGMAHLARIGAKIGVIQPVSGIREVERLTPRDGSILMLAVHVVNKSRVIGGHAIYAFRTPFGQLRFFDRTVGSTIGGMQRGVFTSIEEIAPYYGATSLLPYEGCVVYNVYVRSVGLESPRLAIPVLGIIAERS